MRRNRIKFTITEYKSTPLRLRSKHQEEHCVQHHKLKQVYARIKSKSKFSAFCLLSACLFSFSFFSFLLLSLYTSKSSNLLLSSLELLQQLRRGILSVSLGVILRPPPEILARVDQRALCLPAQLLVRARRVRGQVEHVAVAAGSDFVGQIAAHGGAEGLDHLEDRAALAGAQVPGAHAGAVCAQVVEGLEVAVGEVEDVDVVADGGAVVGGVV